MSPPTKAGTARNQIQLYQVMHMQDKTELEAAHRKDIFGLSEHVSAMSPPTKAGTARNQIQLYQNQVQTDARTMSTIARRNAKLPSILGLFFLSTGFVDSENSPS